MLPARAVSISVVWLAVLVMPWRAAPARAQDAAQGDGPPLTFVGPEGCPTRQDLVLEVERILNRPWSALPSDAAIAVQLEARDELFVVTVVLAEGERTLRDRTCRPLMLAAALIIALAIDPEAALLAASTPVEPPPAPPPITPEPEMPERDLGSPYDLRVPPVPPPLLGIGVGVALDVGLLPLPSAGPVIEGVLRIESFDVRIAAMYLAPASGVRSDGFGAEVSAWLGAVRGCFRPIPDPRLAICAGAHAGALLGNALGPVTTPEPGSPAGAWVAASAGLWLPWAPWDALDLELSVEGLLSVLRPRFEIEGLGPIFEPVAVGARFGLTVHLNLRP